MEGGRQVRLHVSTITFFPFRSLRELDSPASASGKINFFMLLENVGVVF